MELYGKGAVSKADPRREYRKPTSSSSPKNNYNQIHKIICDHGFV
jgi:hypothetical protein